MRFIFKAAVLTTFAATTLFAAEMPTAGSKVYIEPNEGFETYYTSAMLVKKVPMSITTDKEQADYIINLAAESKKAGWAKMVFQKSGKSSEELSVVMVEAKSGDVVWACSAQKDSAFRGKRSIAEACSKRMNKLFK